MSRRLLVSGCLLMVVAMAACGSSVSPSATLVNQEPTRSSQVYRLLVMDSSSQEPYSTAREALCRNLATFGYVQGENLFVTYYSIGNDQPLGRRLLIDELEGDYDVVFVNGTAMATAARDVALGRSQHHFVFACVTDPVGLGLVEHLGAPPSHNFTGVSYPVPVASRLRFVRELMPEACTLGMVYAEMEPSTSYRRWVEDLLANDDEFRDLEVVFRSVPAQLGEDGPAKMAALARPLVRELEPLVDLYLAPNDQMGVERYYAEMVAQTADKPLVGLGLRDVTEGWGATMSIYASQEAAGRQCAVMIKRLFEGELLDAIWAEWPTENGYAFDLCKTEQFGIQIPFEMIVMAGDNIIPCHQ